MTADRVLNGLISYADSEIMPKLPTSSKWVFGTGVNLATNKITDLIVNLQDNSIAKMLGIVDGNGEIDVDALILAMKQSADRYGDISFDVPLVGKLTFSSGDIDRLRNYLI